jgi:phosphate transport system substrate-binding protein
VHHFQLNLIEDCKAGFATSTSHSYQYSGISSSGGRTNAINGLGNFWFSDGIFPAATKPATIKHAPIVGWSNWNSLQPKRKRGKDSFTDCNTIAGIFGGKITKWNDPAIVKDANRTVTTTTYVTKNGVIVKNADGSNKVLRTKTSKISFTLPNRPIKVVYRTDGSGSTENFVNYMKKATTTDLGWTVNSTFTTAFRGTGATVDDAGNLGRYIGRGQSLGVANQVASTVDSITYVEPSFASGAARVASVINASGSLVDPLAAGAVASFLAAAKTGSQEGTYDFDYKTKEAGAYPISIVSYLLFDTAICISLNCICCKGNSDLSF